MKANVAKYLALCTSVALVQALAIGIVVNLFVPSLNDQHLLSFVVGVCLGFLGLPGGFWVANLFDDKFGWLDREDECHCHCREDECHCSEC